MPNTASWLKSMSVGDNVQITEPWGEVVTVRVTSILHRENKLTGNWYVQTVWLSDHTKIERNIFGGYTREGKKL